MADRRKKIKKSILAFSLGALVGTIVTYVLKERELERIRELFDDDDFEDDEYEDDFFDEDLDQEEVDEAEETIPTVDFEKILTEGQNSALTEDDIR